MPDRGPGPPLESTCRLCSDAEGRGQFTTYSRIAIGLHMWEHPTRSSRSPGRSVELHMLLARDRMRPIWFRLVFGWQSGQTTLISLRVRIAGRPDLRSYAMYMDRKEPRLNCSRRLFGSLRCSTCDAPRSVSPILRPRWECASYVTISRRVWRFGQLAAFARANSPPQDQDTAGLRNRLGNCWKRRARCGPSE